MDLRDVKFCGCCGARDTHLTRQGRRSKRVVLAQVARWVCGGEVGKAGQCVVCIGQRGAEVDGIDSDLCSRRIDIRHAGYVTRGSDLPAQHGSRATYIPSQ